GTSTAGTYYAESRDNTGSGCLSATRTAVTLTVNPNPAAPTGSDVMACSNTLPASLTVTTPGGVSVDWYDSPSGGFLLLAGNNSYSTSSAGTYYAEAESGSCLSTSRKAIALAVNPSPSATLSGNNTICLGQPTSMHLVFTGTGPWDYTISDGTQNIPGSSSSNPDDINIIPNAGGNHVYTVTVLSDANCNGSSTGSAVIDVNTAPPATTIGSISGAAEACSGDIQLMTATTAGGPGLTYSWNTGSNSSVVLFSTNISGPWTAGPFSTTANTVYAQFGSLAASSGYNICTQAVNGCGSSNNKCDWIRGKVSVPGTIVGSTVACPGNVKTYSCGISGGASTYTWTLGGSTSPITSGQGNSSPVQVTYPAGFTSGQLCVTASLACGGSSTSAPRCVLVSATPVVPGAFTSSPSRVCPGQSNVLFTVGVSNYAGYNWTVPVGATIVETPPYTNSIHVNFPTPYTGAPPVCAYATSACATSVGRCKTVGSNVPGQPGSMTGPINGVCAPATVQYSVSFDPLATSYTWVLPSGATGVVQNGSSIQFSMSGNFTTGYITVYANTNLCTPGISPARTLTVNGKPSTPGTITAFPTTWCPGGFPTFSIVPPNTPLPTFNWTVSNGTITAGQGSNNIDV
ncbi:MAG: hypothetical protein ABI855_18085, partial [Bacteroidota bacterium]